MRGHVGLITGRNLGPALWMTLTPTLVATVLSFLYRRGYQDRDASVSATR